MEESSWAHVNQHGTMINTNPPRYHGTFPMGPRTKRTVPCSAVPWGRESTMAKKIQLKVALDQDEIEIIKAELKKRYGDITWTAFIRKVFKLPPKNPRPCARAHDTNSAGPCESTPPEE